MKRLTTLFCCLLGAFPLIAQVNFTDISASAGINYQGYTWGMTFGDFNQDGYEDIYVGNRSGKNRLYINQGDNTFIETAETAGVSSTESTNIAITADIDNDGFLDLYLGNQLTSDQLFLGNGDGTFREITSTAGIRNVSKPHSVNLADVDNDGFLDIYISNVNDENVLYHNNGDNTFTNITQASGATDHQISMGSVFLDYDNDGDQDLYLTHDGNQKFILYQNDGTGKFTDVSDASGAGLAAQGMGVDIGDFNRDGWMDIYVTNLFDNFLLKNNGDGTFSEMGEPAGVNDYGMSWGTAFMDYNNDGWTDIYMINDSHFSDHDNQLYKNNGDNTFSKVSNSSILASPYGDFGGACADINNDGWLDIMVANNTNRETDQLFLNTGEVNQHYISLKLEGTTSNRSGIGTRVAIYYGNDEQQFDEVTAGNGFASQNSLTQHFGIGEATSVDQVILQWPSGINDTIIGLPSDSLYVVEEGNPFKINEPTALEDDFSILSDFSIAPNPAQSNTLISFSLQTKAQATIQITDLLGRTVYTFPTQHYAAGTHQLPWNTTDQQGNPLAKGLYLLSFEVDGKIAAERLVVE